MKFLNVGLGSMGKRRIRNLQHLQAGEIIGFDPRQDRCQEVSEKYRVKAYTDFAKAVAEKPDIFIISTPPDRHVEYALNAAKLNKHFFMEASVVLDGMDKLIKLCRGKNIVAAPSCTMRFHPAIKEIRNIVKSGKYGRVVDFNYYVGQYLPDWHPWEAVTDFYVSKKETGGCREIVPFELTWIVDVIGFPRKVLALFGNTRDVGADIDDTYAIALSFDKAFGSLMVDVTARYAVRNLILNLEGGQVLWNWDEAVVKLYDAATQQWMLFNQPQNQSVEGYNKNITENMYIDEMNSFIGAVEGKNKFPNSLEEDAEVLKLLYRMEGRS